MDGDRLRRQLPELAVLRGAAALAASAATISLSAFGAAGPWSYDAFAAAKEAKKKEKERRKLEEEMEQRKVIGLGTLIGPLTCFSLHVCPI